MNKAQRKKIIARALEGSIDKWQKIVDFLRYKRHVDWDELGDLERGGRNCPLCRLLGHGVFTYYTRCPVAVSKVVMSSCCSCTGTPYYDFTQAEQERDLKNLKKYAKKELEFLESLRKVE